METNGVPEQVGRYRVQGEVGSGGMGTVYLGWDELLERRVAIKALHPHRAMDEEARRRFLREARSLSRLAHPGICTIHDILDQGGTQYLILEYIEGTSIRTAIRDDSLPWETRLEIAEELLEAVAAAHAAGLVHRDLKPANVMLRSDGGIAVLDFGLARSQDGSTPASSGDIPETGSLTQDAVVVGTPGYIPPEQAVGRASGPAGDVYTLGLVLQELLTGKPAFDAGLPWYQLLAAASDGELRPVNLRQPELCQLIEQMTSLTPEDRPTAEEALASLREVRRAPERRRRQRLLAAAVAAAATLSLLAGIGIRRWLLPPPLLTTGEHARVAVLPFAEANKSGAGGMGTGVAAMLSRTLASHPRLSVVPVAEIVRSPEAGTGKDPRRTARSIGARILVSGKLDLGGEQLSLAVRVFDLQGGLQRFRVHAGTLPDLLALTSSELIRRIAPGETVIDPRERFSPNPLASLAYAAGESRRLEGGSRAALPYFEVSIDRDPQFRRAVLGKVMCLEALGRWKEGLDLANRLVQATRDSGDAALETVGLDATGTLHLRLGHFAMAESLWKTALDLARQNGQTPVEIGLEKNLGVLAQKRGNLDEAARRYRTAARLAIRDGDFYHLANAELDLGSVERARGRVAPARRHFQRALHIYRRLERLEDTGLAQYNLGAVAWMAGDLDQAQRRFKAALDLQRRAGNRRLAAEALEGLAALAWARGQSAEAAARIGEALKVYRDLGHLEGIARASGNLATILIDQGRWPKALKAAQECLSTSDELGLKRSQVVCRALLAQALALVGHPSEAERVLGAGDLEPSSPDALTARALILYRRGRLAEAIRTMEDALHRARPPERARLEIWASMLRRAARSGQPLPLRPEASAREAPSPPRKPEKTGATTNG